ncbi:MAG: CinA family protein [Erysipelotrichia bacterium]|jgi:PncC family amidohydrolase|nr:CinA family protein [Erysipelotrichia bacterium]
MSTLHQLCIEHQLTLACAESMSGGAFSASITRNTDASKYFLGGVVSYSNQSKINLLHVPPEIIETYGVYSTECVESMARGIYDLFHSDISVAISGQAGHHHNPQNSLLEIYSCIIFHDKIETFKDKLNGSRIDIINESVDLLHKRCISIIERGYHGSKK